LTDFTIEMGMDEGAFPGLLLGLGNSVLANTGATIGRMVATSTADQA
jgi:hypothetical protein